MWTHKSRDNFEVFKFADVTFHFAHLQFFLIHKLMFLHVRWFYQNLSRVEAEDMLSRIPHDGSFLVRQRTEEHNVDDISQFAISFR